MAPERRRQGIGKAMVLQFVSDVLANATLLCEIYENNIASERIASALGLCAGAVIVEPDANHPHKLVQ